MEDRKFYDIHTHAMNLSHPYLLPFVQRLKIDQLLLLSSLLSLLWIIGRPITRLVIEKKLNRVKNLLSVMENDIGSFFLMVEQYLKEDQSLWGKGRGLNIGGNSYQKIVLTPLMMDFGYKGVKDPNIYYNRPAQKPIVEQVIDVFNGIKKYRNNSQEGIFEIYPFLGLNTANYDMARLERMLDKYFGHYEGSPQALFNNMGRFDGDIEHIGSNCFAGIKVYPPLGFDPWPDKGKDQEAFDKVCCLYRYCCQKGIPITAHGSEGGFVVVPKKQQKTYTAVSKWASVLGTEEFCRLKLNLAHFPVGETFLKIFPRRKRLRAILKLISAYENIYVDFSNRAINHRYYDLLKRLIDESPGDLKAKLKKRVLFGSDFTINLLTVESYNQYLDIFARNTSLTAEEKDGFCRANPERFLFSGQE
jgi:predicted TIM-barrel fold metal-dependent hydrolase